MLLAWILSALLLLRGVVADEPVFAIPVEEGLGVEYYDCGKIRFAIYLEKVSWEEAKKLCHGRKGGLVEYTKEGTAEFIGRALAESAVGFSSLWIGGDFTPSTTIGGDGLWKWSQSQEPIESKLDGINKFPMTSPPYWVDRPVLESRVPLCLATDRNMHHEALIVGVLCHMKRPYICSHPIGNLSTEVPMTVTPPVTVGGKTFHFYGHFVTWTEALTQCRLLGMKLAKLTTAQEFRIIRDRMLRRRPIMENAWISGVNAGRQWVWIGNNEPINVDPSRADSDHPFVWYRRNNIIMDGCLLADRHLCDHFVYVEAKCDRRRNFICEKEVRHIWLGGYLFGKNFKWANDADNEPPDDMTLSYERFEGLHQRGEKGRLYFLDNDFEAEPYLLEYKCLNLDRDNQKFYSMYGLKCHHKQHFICKSVAGQEMNKSCVNGMMGIELTPQRVDVGRAKRLAPPLYVASLPTQLTTTEEPNGIRESWLRIGKHTRFWINHDPDKWKSAKGSCQKCLGGYLFLLLSPAKGQRYQMRLINTVMKLILPNETSNLWLGHFKFETQHMLRLKHPGQEFGVVVNKTFPIVRAYDGRLIYFENNCPVLTWKENDVQIIEESCKTKRHTICISKINELDPSCCRDSAY